MTEQDNLEIERRFIVRTKPRGLTKRRGIHIRQGYLVTNDIREVRIRQKGRSFFMTIKDGEGLVRHEKEIRISQKQFDELWPQTKDIRLEKIRYRIPWDGHVLEVDVFKGSLAPLVLAEVEFDTIEDSEVFAVPDFCTEDVTDRPEYRNAHLAIHGQPDRTAKGQRMGALPYLVRNGRLHIVIITNRSGTRWIIPKGQPEKGMSRRDIALMEAVEEAGVIGMIEGTNRAQCKLKDGVVLHVYPLKVSTLLKKWPEESFRKRTVLPAQKAIRKLGDRAMRGCVERLVGKLKNTVGQ